MGGRVLFRLLLGAAAAAEARDSLDTVLARIRPPAFRDATYSVADFGAVGDGSADDLPAFLAAMRKANADGGGTVDAGGGGTYLLAGPLELSSNVHLRIGAGTTLKFSPDTSKYLPPVLTKFEGTELYNYSPLVRAFGATNVAVSGAGPSSVIDGSGEKWFSKSSKDTDKLRAMGNDSYGTGSYVPVSQRVFGAGHQLPPNFVEPFNATNVLLENLTLTGSPFWTVHPVMSTNVIVRNVTIETTATKNSDGVDPEGSVDVLIEGCTMNTGDDGVAIKAGRDADGWRLGRPTQNIVVRHNTIRSKTNGICIGSEISGGVSNVYAYENHIAKCGDAIYFKSNLDRGSYVRDVDVWDVTADSVGDCVVFTNNYHGARGGDFPTLFEGYDIRDCTCTKASGYAITAGGLAEQPLRDVNITNLKVPSSGKTTKISNVVNWRLANVVVNGQVINKTINPSGPHPPPPPTPPSPPTPQPAPAPPSPSN